MKNHKVGEKIRYLRNMRAMTQKELAEQANITKSYLSNLENDKVENVSLYVVFNLAMVLGVTVDELLGMEKLEDGETEYLLMRLRNAPEEKRKLARDILEILLKEG